MEGLGSRSRVQGWEFRGLGAPDGETAKPFKWLCMQDSIIFQYFFQALKPQIVVSMLFSIIPIYAHTTPI